MKNITLFYLCLWLAIASNAQPTTNVYPLRVYLNKNHPPFSFTFFDEQGRRLSMLIAGVASPDSLTFLLPKGKLIMRCSFMGKQLDLGIVKRPMPDTIRFHQ